MRKKEMPKNVTNKQTVACARIQLYKNSKINERLLNTVE
jgi:hypothetical protein